MSTVTPTVPPQRGEEELSLHNDWFPSGWMHVLPRHHALLLTMLFGTATVRQLRGNLDTLAVQVFGDEPGRGISAFGDEGLDSPLLWLEDDDLEYAESPEDAAQIRADAEEHQAWFEAALRAASLPVPSTVRELAAVMESFGIVQQSEGRWSVPYHLPRPENVLALPDEILARLQSLRRHLTIEPAKQALLSYLADSLGYPAAVSTSLDRLERATGCSVDELREALDYLADEEDYGTKLLRGDPAIPVRARDLAVHARFQICMDWQQINENTINVQLG
ncbi:DUF6042 family protein [Streptomyces sp. 769]|uniref:DUF6042 family protein n=1 Tax=Streptomyces sp. 769 TaxID=1262452 RepID=UPI000589D155|nr:DUF6042 family protein [Streptomyces sp. 769]